MQVNGAPQSQLALAGQFGTAVCESQAHIVLGQSEHAACAAAANSHTVQELRQDIVRLTERLAAVVSTNAELLGEHHRLTASLQVRACHRH